MSAPVIAIAKRGGVDFIEQKNSTTTDPHRSMRFGSKTEALQWAVRNLGINWHQSWTILEVDFCPIGKVVCAMEAE